MITLGLTCATNAENSTIGLKIAKGQ